MKSSKVLVLDGIIALIVARIFPGIIGGVLTVVALFCFGFALARWGKSEKK